MAIKLLPMTNEHLGLFAPPRKLPEVEPEPSAASTRPSSNTYEFKNDGFDEYRRVCQSFFSQSYAEKAIRAVRILGWDFDEFHIALENAKARSEGNVRKGKCPVENFGKFFVSPLVARANAIEEEYRREEAESRHWEYMNSPEGKKAEAERKKAIAADPLHDFHFVDLNSILGRVKFAADKLDNFRQADRLKDRVSRHVHDYVNKLCLPTQESVDEKTDLKSKIMRRALAEINDYYDQETLATPVQLEAAIDKAIETAEPKMPPLFASAATEVAHD